MGRFDALTSLENTPENKASSREASPTINERPSVQKTKKLSQVKKTKALSQKDESVVDTTTPRHHDTMQQQTPEKSSDTSLLTTKEKTKYGTYLTDESIEKISIRAIQFKRDAHQIVQEAINQYFERLEK